MLAVTTTPRAFDGNLRFVGANPRIRVALGLHPELVKDRHQEVSLFCAMLSQTRYVGEVGLDGSPEHRSTLDLQRDVFRTILEACKSQGGKIISLHSRMAAGQVVEELERAGAVGTPILHWFSGTQRELKRAVELGCWFSVGPAMLASMNGRKLASIMPRDRILPETDGPFGQINGHPLMPWDSERVLPILAELWQVPELVVARAFSSNLRRLVS